MTCIPPTTAPGTNQAPVDPPLDPSRAGVNKESVPDPRWNLPDVAMPDGVTLAIPEVWVHAIDGSSPQNSLTAVHEDETEITLSTQELETYGANGTDLINFLVVADLSNLKERATIVYAVAWDPAKWPGNALLAQGNLPSAPVARWARRVPFLPDYPFMRRKGSHELVIAAQLRKDLSQAKDFGSWSEAPHVGPIVSRSIRINIVD